MSKALKAKGFKFVGPVIVYAFMQAVGMVNDHVVTCPWHGEVARLARPAKGAG
ncbi:MAG TPA: DNA-3-methyladenine glycosylase I, partial [Caulobacteraceae bacterium]|nr:DNA-3-methyladenine glycosylase I [Caulobacteraceae bacterium]